jgi:hypothetical protein
MIGFGIALIVGGIVLVAFRRFSGERGARTQNAFFGKDVVKPAWVEAWNLILGAAMVIGGIVVLATSA